jgi:hypothetical protein
LETFHTPFRQGKSGKPATPASAISSVMNTAALLPTPTVYRPEYARITIRVTRNLCTWALFAEQLEIPEMEVVMAYTEAALPTEEYLRLGGKRKAAADDNKMSIRRREEEPTEAQTYWKSNIACLHADRQKDVESFLPSISSDTL